MSNLPESAQERPAAGWEREVANFRDWLRRHPYSTTDPVYYRAYGERYWTVNCLALHLEGWIESALDGDQAGALESIRQGLKEFEDGRVAVAAAFDAWLPDAARPDRSAA